LPCGPDDVFTEQTSSRTPGQRDGAGTTDKVKTYCNALAA